MPNITLNWQSVYNPSWELYGTNNWIYELKWRNAAGNLIPTTFRGLYVIFVTDTPVYAGKAVDVRDRFDKRSKTLRDFNIDPIDDMPNRTIYIARVSVPQGQLFGQALTWAEKWLIRHLRQNYPDELQNSLELDPFSAPPGGLTITHDNRSGEIAKIITSVFDTYTAGTQV